MKKIIPVFISLIFVVVLSACSGVGKSVKFSPKINEPFIVNAKIQYGDEESDASFRKYGKANWDIEFSSPNTLAGVILSYRDEKVSASYKGLSFSVPKTALPIKSIISAFIEAVDSCSDMPEINITEKDGIMEAEGELEQGKYTLKFDNTGAIIEYTMTNLSLKITFSDFHADSSDMPESTQPEATQPECEPEPVTQPEPSETAESTESSEEETATEETTAEETEADE